MAYSLTLLTNKVGIVTGAGSPFGIGRSLVMSLALAGAKAVYATDLTLVNIPSLQQEVKDAGSSCQVHGAILDVTSEDQTVSVLKEIIATYGRLDFYFANAGFGNYKTLEDTDAKYYDFAINVMQRSFFLALKYGGNAMCNTSNEKPRPSGSIIVTSSMAGVSGAISDISYSTAKAAVAGMLKSASVQLSASHIRVNSIAPGFVKSSIAVTSANTVSGTAFDEKLNEENAKEVFDSVLGRHAEEKYYYNRIPEPIEIANIGVFLASDLSASVNAQNIVADSGKTAAAFGETIIAPVKPMKPLEP
ncbi:hypothetical protein MRS44_011070 [Fusarium solani]|uniref:uncharacterized protein n=1 Tax=Fusarium solani TaxID=169388 RepID=UPI0032C40D9A|nr:hypothetical protein MRS44_011070 [Fusarium solani]